MAATGYTPILIYASGTAAAVPLVANLTTSATTGAELAINYTDGKLYYKDAPSGSIQVLATKGTGTIGGSTTQVQYNLSGALAGSANMTFNGTTLTVNDLTDSSLTSGRVTYAGASGNLVDSANLTFNGTTLTANTIGAYTLSGTIAGGGNQINNVIIGTSTPLAGSFTTINASTSITNAGLTSGRVTFAGASGLLSDSSTLTYDGTSLTTPRLVLGGTTLPSAGTATLFSRTSDNNTYLQTGSGNNINFLDGSQNTLVNFSPASLSFNISNTNKLTLNSTSLYTASGVKVGIGLSNPATTLDIVVSTGTASIKVGDGTVSGAAYINLQGVTAAKTWFISSNYNVGGALEFTQSTANGGSTIAGTALMLLDASGNLGIGVTPSAWDTALGTRAIQLKGGSVLGYRDTNLILTQNAYFDGAFKYYASSIPAGYYGIGSGVHSWYTSTSAQVINTDPVFTQAMTLNASGNLLLGTTTQRNAAKFTFEFNGSTNNGLAIMETATASGVEFVTFLNPAGTNIANITRVGVSDAVTFNTTSSNTTGAQLNASGVRFPATQVASADANTLDDYEEGTWNASGITAINCTGVSFSEGRYTKIGNIVHIQGKFTLTVTTANTLTYVIMASPFTPLFSTSGSLMDNGSLVSGTLQITDAGNAYAFFAASASLPAGATLFYVNAQYQV